MGGADPEFAPWPTPLADVEFDLISLAFDAIERTLVAGFERPGRAAGYRVTFHAVHAFRMLDEQGLLQFWDPALRGPPPFPRTFRVRGHRWAHESTLSFLSGTEDGWSHVIATGDDCLEVLTRAPPQISAV